MRSVVLAAFAILCFIGAGANASPFRLDYVKTQDGAFFNYDFRLTVDNNDGSFFPGFEIDMLVVGDTQLAPSPFSEGAAFFTVLPPGAGATTVTGFHNGPTIGFVDGTVIGDFLAFAAIGDFVEFSGRSSANVADGNLHWAYLQGDFVDNAFETANEVASLGVTTVPLPAGLPLLGAALAVLGVKAFRRKRAAA